MSHKAPLNPSGYNISWALNYRHHSAPDVQGLGSLLRSSLPDARFSTCFPHIKFAAPRQGDFVSAVMSLL
jgi:hypothetical protein